MKVFITIPEFQIPCGASMGLFHVVRPGDWPWYAHSGGALLVRVPSFKRLLRGHLCSGHPRNVCSSFPYALMPGVQTGDCSAGVHHGERKRSNDFIDDKFGLSVAFLIKITELSKSKLGWHSHRRLTGDGCVQGRTVGRQKNFTFEIFCRYT